MHKLLGIALAASLLAAVTALPASANHAWSTYHWGRTANPFTIKVGDNLTNGWSTYLTQALSDWNQSTVAKNTVVAGQSTKRCRATSGRDEICNGTYGSNGWLGLASISLSGGHIVQGTVKVNDTYFNTSTYNNQNEKQHVMCQEVGHTWGLDHQDTTGMSLNTCMDYFSNTGSNATNIASTTPNAGDYDQLLCVYDPASSGKTLTHAPHSCTGTGHLDSTTTIGASVFPGAAAENVPWWANRNESVYVEQLPNGLTQITYILWAVQL